MVNVKNWCDRSDDDFETIVCKNWSATGKMLASTDFVSRCTCDEMMPKDACPEALAFFQSVE